MPQDSKTWVSGNWQVAEGNAETFVDRWTDFLTWTKDANPGFLSARLIRDLEDPLHFVSFASWQDVDSVRAWKQQPDFAEHFQKCRALCTDMRSAVYELARAI